MATLKTYNEYDIYSLASASKKISAFKTQDYRFAWAAASFFDYLWFRIRIDLSKGGTRKLSPIFSAWNHFDERFVYRCFFRCRTYLG